MATNELEPRRRSAGHQLKTKQTAQIRIGADRLGVQVLGERKSLPLPGGKMAESVASQIEEEIINLGWPIGRVIGSEAELMERFGVSRAVLREAIRLLEHHHVAKMRRGPGGGLQIAEPEPDAVTRAAALYLGYQGVGRRQLLEARMTIETQCVELAAQRLDEAGIARLRQALEDEKHPQPSGMEIHQLHWVIADLAGNEALRLFVDVLTKLTRTLITPEIRPQVRRGEFQPDAHRVHELIVDALIAGDVPLARHRMRRHLEAIGRFLPPKEQAGGGGQLVGRISAIDPSGS